MARFKRFNDPDMPTPPVATYNEYDGTVALSNRPNKTFVLAQACASCNGMGTHRGDRVPYGSTSVSLPAEPCEECWGTGIDLQSTYNDGLVTFIHDVVRQVEDDFLFRLNRSQEVTPQVKAALRATVDEMIHRVFPSPVTQAIEQEVMRQDAIKEGG